MAGASSPTVFEQQRADLVKEIAVGMEQVLQNINRLNRNLESIVSVGNEFGSVEALWSQFENFMGTPENQGKAKEDQHQHQHQHHGDEQAQGHDLEGDAEKEG